MFSGLLIIPGSPYCGLPYSAPAQDCIITYQSPVELDRLPYSLFMGISLAFLDNLASNLLAILHYSAVSVTVIILCNIAALFLAGAFVALETQLQARKLPRELHMAPESPSFAASSHRFPVSATLGSILRSHPANITLIFTVPGGIQLRTAV